MASTALLIIDMINKLDFPEGKRLLRSALPIAKNILKIKKKFNQRRLPVIYVNDNFGNWKSDWKDVYHACTQKDSLGRELGLLLEPTENDYFILKPMHSAFYSTNLDILLRDLKVKKLVITGIAGNICVLFTANDAHMRGYKIHVPQNCIASNSKTDNRYVIRQLSHVLNIKTSSL